MSVGTSNRVVIEVDTAHKQQIYAALKARGLTMRDFFYGR
jgi:lambda repressor-like predicted transcriptional regulator